ncbi:MAG: GyrI-like domain-containing protein [Giesbergeria sp.]
MTPLRQHQDAFSVAGFATRTTNHAERDPQTALIAPLWGRFFAENVMGQTPNRSTDLRNFGVYSGYESDAHGAYDVTLGVAVTQGATITIEAGDYLVFPADGPVPMSVISAWKCVWQYFEAHPEVQRRYRTDFEAYSSPTEAAVYIGVV